jgi:hypothetical protein
MIPVIRISHRNDEAKTTTPVCTHSNPDWATSGCCLIGAVDVCGNLNQIDDQVDASRQWRSKAALKSLRSLTAANRLFGPTCVASALLRKYPSERLVRREKKSRGRTLNRSDEPSLAKACWTSPAVGPKRLGNSRPANVVSVSAAACYAISPRSLRLPRVRT